MVSLAPPSGSPRAEPDELTLHLHLVWYNRVRSNAPAGGHLTICLLLSGAGFERVDLIPWSRDPARTLRSRLSVPQAIWPAPSGFMVRINNRFNSLIEFIEGRSPGLSSPFLCSDFVF